MSKTETEDEAVDLQGTEDATSDVLLEDYKDMEIELMDSSRAKPKKAVKKTVKAVDLKKVCKAVTPLINRSFAKKYVKESSDVKH